MKVKRLFAWDGMPFEAGRARVTKKNSRCGSVQKAFIFYSVSDVSDKNDVNGVNDKNNVNGVNSDRFAPPALLEWLYG